MKTYQFCLIALIATLLLSCKDASINPEHPDLNKVYLESEYVNFAWGYAHNGWFIDTSGNIISYDIAKSGTQWVRNSSEYYSEDELWAKIHHKDTLREVIPNDTLKHLRELALASVAGTLSDTVCPGADMGALVYSCYVFKPDSLKFQRIVLRVYGDCRFNNAAQSAIDLAHWISRRQY